MTGLLKSPAARLLLRAVLAGLAAGIAALNTSGEIDQSVLSGAATAAGLAFCEAFTPLNGLVGLFKQRA